MDLAQVAQWWTDQPDANIGVACGLSDLVVLDFDWRNGGDVAWNEWGKDLHTLKAITPGGVHLYFNHDGAKLHGTAAEGVDVRANHYVLAPPSVTYGTYEWEEYATKIEDLPEWLREELEVKAPPTFANDAALSQAGTAEGRPGDAFNSTHSWGDVLEPHGWQHSYTDSGVSYWIRPGKSYGVSASTNWGEHDLLYVFTSSTEFGPDTGYSKFTAYTLINHGGDFNAAATALASEQRNVKAVNMFEEITDDADGVDVSDSDYAFDPAFVPGSFVGDFINYAELQTDAALEYHEASALIGLSTATAGVRGRLAPFPGGLPTNLFAILVGTTTRSRKSTAQKIMADMVKSLNPFTPLADRETPEAFIQSLAARSGFSTLWTPDELGISIAEIYTRDYMATLEGLLLQLYSGSNYTYQRASGGPISVSNPHLSVLGAATPESLGRAGATALDSGLLPRFAIVFPTHIPPAKPVAEMPEDVESLQVDLRTRLKEITTYAAANPNVSFSREALARLNEQESLLGLSSGTARLPVMLYKVAMLSAISDLRSKVNLEDAEAACTTVSRWAQGVDNLRPFLYARKTDREFEAEVQRAYDTLQGMSGRSHRSLVARKMRLSQTRLDQIEHTLQDWGMITVEVQQGGKMWLTTDNS